MPELITASEVEQVIRSYLKRNGCSVSSSRKWGETGADIIATRGKSTWFVEIIGFHSNKSVRSRKFYEAFFRAISRDRNNPDDVLVIGLPARFKAGMRQRMNQYPVAWQKLGKVFPSLQIWYADISDKTVKEHLWVVPFD